MSDSGTKSRPFSIRLSQTERTILENRALGRPVGAYVKAILFPEKPVEAGKATGAMVHDPRAIARLLAALGASHLASNFNQIAKAANQGALPVTQELEAELWAACAQVAEMRSQLLTALGLRTTELPKPRSVLAQTFNRRAGGAQ